MLKIRVLSSMAGLALLMTIVILGKTAIGVAVFFAALVGIHEFYCSLEQFGYRPIKTAGYLSCLLILLIALNDRAVFTEIFPDKLRLLNFIAFYLFILLVAMFMFAIFRHDRYNLNDLSLTVFGILYVTFLFSFIVLTRNLQHGNYYIWLIFIGAWSTDTFAYFTGISIGKTKFLPAISKHKTIEGSIGGLIGCITCTVIYGVYIVKQLEEVQLYHFVIIGFLCGIVSQLGDWAASAIKRYVKVKDFGRLMPGHGGLLDRFDSILFIAPVIYFYIGFIINIK